jgi:pimeloyl-ACP methyl ester carboxylesterase
MQQEQSTLLTTGFTEGFVMTNGIRLHYVRGGTGPLLVLLHGFPETWYMWRKVLPDLARHYTVIAPDLRGAGQSDAPEGGYEKATMADDIRGLEQQLGPGPINLVGHDMGLMVAYAYAARYPSEVSHLALLEAPIPDESIYQAPALTATRTGVWWFGLFNTPQLPETLIQGRERDFLTAFLRYSVPVHVPGSITETDIARYLPNLQEPARLHALLGYYRALRTDVEQAKVYGKEQLPMPVLALGAEHWRGASVAAQVARYATNVTGAVITGSGHWIAEEQPQALIDSLLAFLSKS